MATRAIIQARIGSTRLPGKVLMDLRGATVLHHVIARVSACAGIDEVVVATSTLAQDDTVAEAAGRAGALVVRGSECDVLSRYVDAAGNAGTIVRITADCPLLDSAVLNDMVRAFHEDAALDYLSNGISRTFPRGLDAEVFTRAALLDAAANATHQYEREHVTPYIYEHADRFRIGQFTNDRDYSHYRWTLDTPEDYQFISAVYDELYDQHANFGMTDVLALLERRPELVQLNQNIRQKALHQ